MTKNKNSTRYFSELQERYVANKFNGTTTPNSGAGHFKKGDVVLNCDMLVECKTCTKEKSSVSIKKEWLEKNREEAFENRLSNHCVCFNFEPEGENYFVINEKLMKFLTERLEVEK